MWTQTKQNYEKHVEGMENWKDIVEEEDQAFKTGLVTLFLMGQEALEPNVVLEFLNTFAIKGANIYFGHKDKVYVISKQLIVDVFGICAKGYLEDSKEQVTLQGCRLAHANSSTNQWNTKNLGLPYFVRYPTTIFVIYQKEKVQYFSNKNAITLMRARKGQEVDQAHIIFNSMCSELDWW